MPDEARSLTYAVPTPADPRPAAGGVLLLLLTTFLWGSTFVITKGTLPTLPPGQLLLGRFALASLVFAPFLRTGRRLWLAAAELGLLLWAGYATQTIGLRYTTVHRSAFITALPVVIVPAVAGLLGRRVTPAVWTAAALALVGVALLSHDGGPPNVGDAWTLLCAVTWAGYITRLETFARRLPALHLTAAHLLVVAALCAVWVALSPDRVAIPGTGYPWKPVVYLGLAATAATTWLQTVGQRSVPAAQTAILYTLEPVFASGFALAVPPHTMLGPTGLVGALVILFAAALTQLPRATPNGPTTHPATVTAASSAAAARTPPPPTRR